ncbi:MAG: NAD(P)-dependent oxidoreductase [Methanomicrobiales archaeon]|nr:NAD(P)-dependent oxidoreductase [Methanomicrobiales archaeon]
MAGIRRVLVTGAHGFLGSHLTASLLEGGYAVTILRREGSDLRRIRHLMDRIMTVNADLRDPDQVFSAVRTAKADAILHLAAYYAVEHTPAQIGVMVDTNVRGAMALLEAARLEKTPLFVNTSTCTVYREQETPRAETDPVAPQNLYDVTKVQAEDACRFYRDRFAVPVVTLRIFPPYGPGDNERRLIPSVIRHLQQGESPPLTSGTQRWDFVHARDIAAAYLAVLAAPDRALRGGLFNVATGDARTVREVVEQVRTLLGSGTGLRWGAVPHRRNEIWLNSGNAEKIRAMLGWEPRVPLAQGLAETVAWFRDHPVNPERRG